MELSPARYRTIAIGALAALAVIIVTGAAVRLTNSGLGCDDWPRCSADRLVDVSSQHSAIEQLNRFFTGVVGLAVIAAVLGSLVRRPRRRDLVVLSVLLVVGVLANAVLGGISVLVDLHPAAVQGHMVLSMALIVTGTVLVRRADEPDGVVRRTTVSPSTRRCVQVLFAMTVLGVLTGTIVTGAGPHAGDEDARRFDVAIAHAARLHGTVVLIAIAVATWIGWRSWRAAHERAAIGEPLSAWVLLGVVQAAIGYIQYFNGVPALLVGVHVAGATALMIATTNLLLATSTAACPDADGPLPAPWHGAAVGAAASADSS